MTGARLSGDVQMVDPDRLDDRPDERGADVFDGARGQDADTCAVTTGTSSVGTPPDPDALPASVQVALDALEDATTQTAARLLRTLQQAVSADADALLWCRIQTEATARLKAAGIKTPSTWVRAAALKAPTPPDRDDTPSGAGRPVHFIDDDPWDAPVDGNALLTALISIIERFIVLPPSGAVAVAGWIVFAWSHGAFYHRPLLTIVSPVKGCGKTTLLSLIAALAPRPQPTSSMTAATIYRVAESAHPTLLLDEADHWQATEPDRMAVLNAGHVCGGRAIRCVGDRREPREFLCDCPKAVAGIQRNGFPTDTLADRSIFVTLAKKTPRDTVESWRGRTTFPEVRGKLCRWAADHTDDLASASPDMGGLQNRAADNWDPLFATADAIGGEWPERMRHASSHLFAAAEQVSATNPQVGEQLLADIRRIFTKAGDPSVLATKKIDEALYTMEDTPWGHFGRHGQPLSGAKRGQLLAPFGVKTAVGLDNETGKRVRVYDLATVQEACERYQTPPLTTPAQGVQGVQRVHEPINSDSDEHTLNRLDTRV